MFTPLTVKEKKEYFNRYYLQLSINKGTSAGFFMLVDPLKKCQNKLYNSVVIANFKIKIEYNILKIENLRFIAKFNKKYHEDVSLKITSIFKSNFLLSKYRMLEISTSDEIIKSVLAKNFILYKKFGCTSIIGLLKYDITNK
jgi:hypothetical protein